MQHLLNICQSYAIKQQLDLLYNGSKSFTLCFKRPMRKIHVNANLLLRKFSRCSVEVKCYLFKTYCSNLYCTPMWFDCTKTALKNNNSLRRFMGLPWCNSASEMFVNLNIRSFDELLRMFVLGFRPRIINSNNLLISSIYNSTFRIYSSMWTWWDNLLYIFNS